MIEAHAHVAALGFSLAMPSLASCASLDEVFEVVRREAQAAARGWRGAGRDGRGGGGECAWVRITGARAEGWREARWPTVQELDRAAGDVACVIMSFDHHAACANSAALAAAGVRGGQRVEPNGVVMADPRTGEATGLLMEAAAYKVWNAAPEADERAKKAAVREGLRHLAALGYREVHDLLSQDWLPRVLGELEEAGDLATSVRLYPAMDRLQEMARGRGAWESERVRLAGGKLFADGTLNSRTALVLEAYREPAAGASPFGTAMESAERIRGAVREAEAMGMHIAVHAIGDGAVRMTLDAIEDASTMRREVGENALGRHRIEHCELIDEADVGRFAELGVVCSVQPCHLLTDVEVLTRQLPGRLGRVLPLRELIDSGCTPQGEDRRGLLWFGSDVPIVRADHEDSVLAATQRRRDGMAANEAIGAEQAVTRAEAVECFGARGSGH